VSVSRIDADVTPLPAGTPPLDCLPSPEPGCFCSHCDFTTVNWDSLLHHFRKTRCDRERRTRDNLSCLLQRWVSVRKNVGRAWRVDTTIPVTQRETDAALSCDQSVVDDPASRHRQSSHRAHQPTTPAGNRTSRINFCNQYCNTLAQQQPLRSTQSHRIMWRHLRSSLSNFSAA
jgi:hypothetical protein